MDTPRKAEQCMNFSQLSQELDQLVSQVKSKDTSLEESLEVFERAIACASRAIDLVDTAELSLEEELQGAHAKSEKDAKDAQEAGAAEADSQEEAAAQVGAQE